MAPGRDKGHEAKARPKGLKAASLLVAVISVLVAAAVGEVFCRVTGHNGQPRLDSALAEYVELMRGKTDASIFQASPDPHLLYELRPNYSVEGERWTEQGGILEVEDVPLEKPDNEFRIVVMGDSIAAMLRRLQERTGELPFPDRVEAILNRRRAPTGRNVRVLNFGTDGYGTLQEAQLLEANAMRYAPDLIILQYCPNDPATSYTPAIWFLEEIKPISYLVGFVGAQFRKEEVHSLDPRRSLFAPVNGPTNAKTKAMWEKMYERDGAPWRRVITGFGKIDDISEAADVPVVVVIFPLLLPRQAGHNLMHRIYKQVEELGRSHDFHVLNLIEAYSKYPVVALQENPGIDHYHPNTFGHNVAARVISDYLTSSGIITSRLGD